MKRLLLAVLSVVCLAGVLEGNLFAAEPAPAAPAAKPAAEPATAAAPAKSFPNDPLDWTNWRGPEQNCTSRETGLVDKWNPKGGAGSNLLWFREDLGTRSSPIVMHGRLFLMVRDQPGTLTEGEKLVCVDAATGKDLWSYRFNVYASDVPDTRTGWASPVGDSETDYVYVQGVSGYFACLEGATGKLVWDRSLHEQYGFITTYGGRTNYPIVFEDMVLASAVVVGWDEMAKPAHRFMAFDKRTGEMRWFAGTRIAPYDTTYSTPSIGAFDGTLGMVFGSGDGAVWSLQPRTGTSNWKYPLSRRGLNASPLILGTTVIAGNGEENVTGPVMGAIVALDGRMKGDLSGKEIWRIDEFLLGKSSPVMAEGYIYAIDDRAKLFVVDPKDGTIVNRKALGTSQFGAPLVADGKIYLCTGNGRWYALQPDAQGQYKTLDKLSLDGDITASPIVSHGRIYLGSSLGMYCIGKDGATPQATAIPPQPAEAPVSTDDEPAVVQVVPCELLLRPGQKQAFTARLFNARGQFLKSVAATYAVKGAGEITPEGVFTATGTAHDAAFVTAQVGKLSGKARIRVVPPLPWKWDFNKDENVPITWLGGRVRHIIREIDGEKVMVKIDQIPTTPGAFTKLGTRSQTWFGQTELSNYTMQADVNGQSVDNKMPDVGLINSRYTLSLLGQGQKVRIYSWEPHDKRAQVSVDFPWKPNTWYTMKLTTKIEGSQAIVRGKVWPRGEKEPDAWTIELTDAAPNKNGSPGLFGNTANAEFYLDNLSVTPNE